MHGPSPEYLIFWVLFYLGVPISAIVFCIANRKDVRKIARILIGTGMLYLAYFVAANYVGRYTLSVTLLGSNGKPIVGARALYSCWTEHHDLFFATGLKQQRGETKTDAKGRIVLKPNHAQRVEINIFPLNEESVYFEFTAADRGGPHVLRRSYSSVTFVEPSGITADDYWSFSPKPEHRFVMEIKKRGDDKPSLKSRLPRP
jgi:hypothetical protein